MSLFVLFKRIALVAGLLPIGMMAYSQVLNPPKIQSPNAASLGTFGEVPVDMFTGTPDISIPIYDFTYGKIDVPIKLRYHPSSVKPSQQPSWVGSGWNLECGGAITRAVRGLPDEAYIDQTAAPAANQPIPYYPYPGQTTTPGSVLANQTGWNTQAGLAPEFAKQSPPAGDNLNIADMQADEFSFNVMGHSGKFYYEGPTLGWVVVSDESIQVQPVDNFYSAQDIYNAIHEYVTQYHTGTSLQIWPDQFRQFGGFKLIMPDGTQFLFGGKINNVPDAVEFTSTVPMASTAGNGSQDQTYTAVTWLLKSITDVYGNTVNFNYSKTYPTCNVLMNYNYWGGQFFGAGCSFNYSTFPTGNTGGNNFLKNLLAANYVWPEYLTSITSITGAVNFSFSPQTYNRYTDNYMGLFDQNNPSTQGNNERDLTVLGLNDYPALLNNIQWEELNNIVITDNLHNQNVNNGQPDIIRQYKFNYLNTPANMNQRLMLGSLQELDKLSNVIGQYAFAYNLDMSRMNASGLPVYSDGNFSDHWGFFNATDVTTLPINIYNGKQPNPTVVTSELLNTITYPTGGSTQLTWEACDYSQVVSVTRNSLLNPSQAQTQYSVLMTGFGGGSRIAEIRNVLADGTTATDKKYYYRLGYSTSTNPTSLPSSGVLNGVPQYSFGVNRNGFIAGSSVGIGTNSFYGTGNYGYKGEGSPVGYKEVDEVNVDGSYSKSLFTTFDADLNDVSHWDIAPSAYLGWVPGDYYFPYSSLERERGKLIAKYVYNASNVLLSQTTFTYRNDAERFNNALHLVESGGEYSYAMLMDNTICQSGIAFGTARYEYNYTYYPTNKTVTNYDQQGHNPVVESTDYTYNSNNLVKTAVTTGSQGEKITHTYNYPTDYNDPTSIAMVNAHILAPVIQDAAVYQAAGSNSPIIPTKTTYIPYYSPISGIYVPQNTQIQIANNPNEIREQFYQYDSHGNIQELSKANDPHDVYLWGYNSQFVVARISNSSYSAVQAAMSQAGITQSQLDQAYNGVSDDQIRSLLNGLRGPLPGAFVTTYTYACGIGMTSQTDPNNRTTYYDYDPMGRLWDIRDQDKNIIKKFCYDYAGQQEACNIYYNKVQNGTFTPSKCSPYTTPQPYTYTVNAGRYPAYTQQQADQLAINDVNANGQNTADAQGTCTPWVSMPIIMGSGGANPQWVITVDFYQGSTLVSNFTFENSGGTVYAPAGTYTVVVNQTNNYSRTVTLDGYGSQTGTIATFNNVIMSGNSFGGTLTVN